jgi:hypothetical protein
MGQPAPARQDTHPDAHQNGTSGSAYDGRNTGKGRDGDSGQHAMSHRLAQECHSPDDHPRPHHSANGSTKRTAQKGIEHEIGGEGFKDQVHGLDDNANDNHSQMLVF